MIKILGDVEEENAAEIIKKHKVVERGAPLTFDARHLQARRG